MKKFKLNKAFWRDVRFLKWAGQILFLFFIINLIQNFFGQAITNLNATNLPFSWRFLGSTQVFKSLKVLLPIQNQDYKHFKLEWLICSGLLFQGYFLQLFSAP